MGFLTSFGEAGAKLILFKYEKLPNFYYRCGMLGYVEEDCDQSEDEDTKVSMGIGFEHHW